MAKNQPTSLRCQSATLSIRNLDILHKPNPYNPRQIMTFHRKTLNLFSATAIAALLIGTNTSVTAAEKGGKKLLVYVLAGQSNMQGHAEVSTLAYLSKPAYVPTPEEWALMTAGLDRSIHLKSETSISENLLKDPANAKLPKKEFGELVKNTLKAEVEKERSKRYDDFKKRQSDPARAARDKELAAIFTPNLKDQPGPNRTGEKLE
ncbi:MAG: hypothetical protein WCS43_09890 [Verrucomicrobiota bacterium]